MSHQTSSRVVALPRAAIVIAVLGLLPLLAAIAQGLVGLAVLPGWFLLAAIPLGLLAALVALCAPGLPWGVRVGSAAVCACGGFMVVAAAWTLLTLLFGP